MWQKDHANFAKHFCEYLTHVRAELSSRQVSTKAYAAASAVATSASTSAVTPLFLLLLHASLHPVANPSEMGSLMLFVLNDFGLGIDVATARSLPCNAMSVGLTITRPSALGNQISR